MIKALIGGVKKVYLDVRWHRANHRAVRAVGYYRAPSVNPGMSVYYVKVIITNSETNLVRGDVKICLSLPLLAASDSQ